MTIETKYFNSDVYAGKVLCFGDGHRHQPTHLAVEHNGYDGDKPLTVAQHRKLKEVAEKHDKEMEGKHTIIIGLFQPKMPESEPDYELNSQLIRKGS